MADVDNATGSDVTALIREVSYNRGYGDGYAKRDLEASEQSGTIDWWYKVLGAGVALTLLLGWATGTLGDLWSKVTNDPPHILDRPVDDPEANEAISWVVAEGLLTTQDGWFDTDSIASRQAAATSLWRLMDRPEPIEAAPFFSDLRPNDLEEGDELSLAMQWMGTANIAEGSNGSFGRESGLTRCALAQFLWGVEATTNDGGVRSPALASPAPGVSDALPCSTAAAWAYSEGLMQPHPDGLWHPERHVTRKSLAIILWRFDHAQL